MARGSEQATFSRLKVSPIYKVVSEAIEREIYEGRLLPGQILPTEAELAEQFGVTRHSVREGIRILEQTGLVQRREGRRLFVSLTHYAELAPRMSRALTMQKVTFRELWEMAMDLEPPAADRAAQRASGECLDQLRECLETLEKNIETGAKMIPHHVRFHTLIAEATGNKALLLAREPISLLFFPALTKLFKNPKTRESTPRRSLYAHQKIFEAIERRDADGARNWMINHIKDFCRGFEVCNYDLELPVDQDVLSVQ